MKKEQPKAPVKEETTSVKFDEPEKIKTVYQKLDGPKIVSTEKIDLSQFQTRPSKPDPNKKKQRKRINNGPAPTQGQNQQGQGGNNNQQGGDKKPFNRDNNNRPNQGGGNNNQVIRDRGEAGLSKLYFHIPLWRREFQQERTIRVVLILRLIDLLIVNRNFSDRARHGRR